MKAAPGAYHMAGKTRTANFTLFAIAFLAALVFGLPITAVSFGDRDASISPSITLSAGPVASASAKDGRKDKPAAKSYVSRISKDQDSITIKGQIPSEGDKKTLQGVIAATFPGAAFIDKMQIDAGIRNRDSWLAGMNFALRQLAKLDKGSATLRDGEISFEGRAKTEEDFKLMQQKLKEEVPNGIVLAETALKPPAVSPFVWLAHLQGGSLNLSGHVPSEEDSHIVSYARSLFSGISISNSMAWAIGAPDEWTDAAKISLHMLNLLQQGTVIVTDTVITVDGILSFNSSAKDLKAFNQRLPKGFKLEASVIEASADNSSVPVEEVNVAVKRDNEPATPLN